MPVHRSSLVAGSYNLPGCYVLCDVGAEAEEEHVTEHNTTTWQNCDGDTKQWLALKTRHAMYCTYNLTLRRVRVTIIVLERQDVFHILSVCL